MFDLFMVVAVCLSGFTCIDLYLSFKNPFYPGYYRMKFYLAGTVLLAMVITPNIQSIMQDPNDLFDKYLLPFYYNAPAFQSKFKYLPS